MNRLSRPLTFTDLRPVGVDRARRRSRYAWALVIGAVVGAVGLSIGWGVYLWL